MVEIKLLLRNHVLIDHQIKGLGYKRGRLSILSLKNGREEVLNAYI